MNDVNIPLLRKAVEWAEVEAEKPFETSQWYQDAYILIPGEESYNPEVKGYQMKCATAYCIAGWTVAMTLGEDESQSANGDVIHALTGEYIADCEYRALAELGLEKDGGLFDCGNSIEEIRWIAEQIAGEPL